MKKFLIILIYLGIAFQGYPQQIHWEWTITESGSSTESAKSIALDTDGNTYVFGQFSGNLTFGSTTLYAINSDAYLAKYTSSGNIVWAKQFSCSGNFNAHDITISNSNEIFLAGSFFWTASFDTIFITAVSNSRDAFFAKLDTSGHIQYVKSYGGSGVDECYSVESTINGDVFLTGKFNNSAAFDSYNLISDGGSDIFVIKTNSTGNISWIRKLGGSGEDYSRSISVSYNNNVFVAGGFYESLSYNSNQIFAYGSSFPDAFIAGFYSSGDFISFQTINGNSSVRATDICSDNDTLYVCGEFTGTIDINGTNYLSNGDYDIFITKYSGNLNFMWAKTIGSNQNDFGNSISLFDDYIVTAGSFSGNIQIDTSIYMANLNVENPFLFLVDPTGNSTTFKYLTSTGNASINDIFPGTNNTLLIAGNYSDTLKSVQESLVSTSGSIDFYVANIPFIAPNISQQSSNITICSGNDTALNLSVSGTPPFSYQWFLNGTSFPVTGSSIFSLSNISSSSSGNYLCIVSNPFGTDTSNIINVNVIELSISSSFSNFNGYNSQCYNLPNASINTNVSGGISPYLYIWSNGETSSNVSGLLSGQYFVTVTDANSCQNIFEFQLNEPPQIDFYLNSVNSFNGYEISCSDSTDGSAEIIVSGGVSPYEFLWSTGETQQQITGLESGIYYATVFDNNNCLSEAFLGEFSYINPWNFSTSSSIHNILVPDTLISSVGGSTLSTGDVIGIFYDSSGVKVCSGYLIISGNTQVIQAYGTVSGSQGFNPGDKFFYKIWQNNGYVFDAIVEYSASASHDSLFYQNGFSILVSIQAQTDNLFGNYIELNSPEPLSLSYNLSDCNGFNLCCNGSSDGFIAAIPTGGVSPYNFEWSSGASTDSIYNLPSGEYSLTLSDNNNCFYLPDTSSTGSIAPNWNYSITSTNHIILIDTTIYPTINGQPIENGDYIGVFYSSGSNLYCGGYMIWDGNLQALTAWGEDPGMNNGFSYNEEFKWKIFDLSAGVEADAITTYQNSFQNLGQYIPNGISGIHTIIAVYNEAGASTVFLSQPDSISVSESISDYFGSSVSCFMENDGYIKLNISGGTPGYQINWSNTETTDSIFNLNSGNYSVTISDSNNCEKTNNYILSQPSELNVNLSSNPLTCIGIDDGSLQSQVTGGTSPYFYAWDNGSSSSQIDSLASGVYFVIVHDINNCQDFGINFIEEPTANAFFDQSVCNGLSAEIFATGTDGFIWKPSNWINSQYSSFAIVNPPQTTIYNLIGYNLYDNLILNPDFTDDTIHFNSDYLLKTSNISEGEFSKTNNSQNANSQFLSCSDYTGFGNMIVFNGATDSTSRVLNISLNILPNTSYLYSLAFMNLSLTNFAVLKLEINGEVVQVASNNDLSCQWLQISGIWESGNDSVVELTIFDTEISQNGNDFAIDHFVFGEIDVLTLNECIASDSVQITVFQSDDVTLTPQALEICLGEEASVSVSPVDSVFWSPSIGISNTTSINPIFSPQVSSWYYYNGVDTNGCLFSDSLFILVNPTPSNNPIIHE